MLCRRVSGELQAALAARREAEARLAKAEATMRQHRVDLEHAQARTHPAPCCSCAAVRGHCKHDLPCCTQAEMQALTEWSQSQVEAKVQSPPTLSMHTESCYCTWG